MRIEYHPAIEHDLKEARDFYDKRVPGLGAQFIEEFERQGSSHCCNSETMDGHQA